MQRFTLLLPALLLAAAPLFAEVKLEIGPDTTVIDGPLNPDGTINYLAYLNQKLSEGVTPENNFAVDVAMVMPPDVWPSQTFRERLFEGLGVPMPDDGPYFHRFNVFGLEEKDVQSESERLEKIKKIINGPWSAAEHPEVEHWLDQHEEVLNQIARAIHKEDFFMPLLAAEGDPEMIYAVSLPWLTTMRGLSMAFIARAQWKIGAGDLQGAWADTAVVHQIANRLMHEPLAISRMVGFSCHRMGVNVVKDLASSANLNIRVSDQIRAGYQLYSVFPGDQAYLNISERMMSLDAVLNCMANDGESPIASNSIRPFLNAGDYDPNFTLKTINAYINKLIEANACPDPLERLRAVEAVADETSALISLVGRMLENDITAYASMQEQIEASSANTVIATYMFIDLFDNGHVSITKLQITTQEQLKLAPVALAIGGYHAEHGAYPPDLHALVPAYLDSLPTDFATGELPVYKVEDGAAIVYSLGTDLEDDGGVDDLNEGDIVFRIQR